jgi:hypothetical protein
VARPQIAAVYRRCGCCDDSTDDATATAIASVNGDGFDAVQENDVVDDEVTVSVSATIRDVHVAKPRT